MPGLSFRTLRRIVARLARRSPPRHRDLVRGMMAELDAIPDPGERTRFALGAIAAIARLTLTGYSRSVVGASVRIADLGEPAPEPAHGGSSMSKPTSIELLRRHATPFAVALASLTVILLANSAVRRVPQLMARDAPADTIAEVMLLAVPHTLALTIPMAVFLAVSWVFTRLGAEGVLASAMLGRRGHRRLVAPVLAAAAVIAAITLALNTQVVPRTNARLGEVLAGAPIRQSDRTMTVGELREAARTAAGANAAARAAAYDVEIQKKFALAVACIVLALAGAATAIRFPRGGVRLVAGASALVFTGYYFALVAGEALADRLVISPWVAMWLGNALLLGLVVLLVWRPGRPGPASRGETVAIGA